MEQKETRFRIINKTSKNVTLKLNGKPMTFSWEDFNKKLIVVDKVWAVLNDEEKKKQEEADELVNQAVMCVLIQRGNGDPGKKLGAISALPGITEKIQELLECSPMDVLNIIRDRLKILNPFMVNPMFEQDKKKHHKLRPKSNLPQNANVRAVELSGEKKPTLGDAFSCLSELKEKMENK